MARAPSTATKTTRCRGNQGFFVGGDVVRPHLLTTAIGHGAIAADGIDRFCKTKHWKNAPKSTCMPSI
jgi:NADPH-dependent glutamate synthase beta subunit-like oxidoreductase